MNHYVLNLRVHGMFSNVNEVIQQLYLAEQNGYNFEINWNHLVIKISPENKILGSATSCLHNKR